MNLVDALPFFPVALLIALTPGPNNLCSLSNGIRHGAVTAGLAALGRELAFVVFLVI